MVDKLEKFGNLIQNKISDSIEKSTTYLHRKITRTYKDAKLIFFYKTVVPESMELYKNSILNHRIKKGKLLDNSPSFTDHPKIAIDSTTSIIFNPIEKKYVYISTAPPIKNLVISGGGAKGIILTGVIKAFEEHEPGEIPLIDEIENIAGSSVGSILAALISSGIKADELIQALSKEDFPSLLGHSKIPIYKDGVPLMDCVRTNMKTSLLQRLEELDSKEDQIQEIIETLRSDAPRITFSMLQTLHELHPATFKSLTITATCRETGETFYFNAKNTPNMDVVTAVRASASLPIVLKPVRIDREHLAPGYDHVKPEKKSLTFTDGGCFNNIPVQTVQNAQRTENKGEQGQNLQTLALVFDETKTSNEQQSPFFEHKVKPHTLYDSTKLSEKFIRNILGKYLGGIKTSKKLTKIKESELEEIRLNYTQRNIPLKISIKTTDFKKAKKHEEKYIQKGYEQGKEYLNIHKGELFYRSFDNLEDLLKQIPEEKQEKVNELLPEFRKLIEK